MRKDERFAEFRQIIDDFAASYLDDYVEQLRSKRTPPKSREFNDPIWGTIVASPPEVTVIDSPIFQRLQDIRQLGTAHHVYRSANHTRFEHSLGSLHAMASLLREITSRPTTTGDAGPEIPERLQAHLRLAALLHDVGHGFMSHVSENAIKSLGWAVDLVGAARDEIDDDALAEGKKPAELASYYIILSPAFRALAEYLSSECALGGTQTLVANVSRAVLGLPVDRDRPFLSQLLSGPFDVDKLDYIQRDAYFCGVPQVIDVNRLLRKLRTTVVRPQDMPAELAETLIDAPSHVSITGIAESGARTLDEFALARSLLTDKVYRHQKTRAQEAQIGAALDILCDLSESPISLIWSLTDSSFTSLSAEELAERAHIVSAGPAARRQLSLAIELRDRFVRRQDFVAAYVWSADRGRDDLLDIDQQTNGIDQLRESARRASSRTELTNDISKTVTRIYKALQQPVPIVDADIDLRHVIRIDQSDDPARLRGRSLLARAFLVSEAGEVLLFSDEYPGTEDWSDLYLVNRDFSAVFCPRELSSAVHLASELVFLRRFGLITTASMLRQAHVESEDVKDMRVRLGTAGFYTSEVSVAAPKPRVLSRASTANRLEAVQAMLSDFNSGLAVKLGFSSQERNGKITADVIEKFLRQLSSDAEIVCMLKAIEGLKLYSRSDLVRAALDAFGSYGWSPESIVMSPLGEPNESSGAATYLVKDELEASGVAFERIDQIDRSDRPNVAFIDDFIGLGSRTVGVLRGWFGAGSDARPIPSKAQTKLRTSSILCVYATGLPGAQEQVSTELSQLGLTPAVSVHDEAPPRLSSLQGFSSADLSIMESLGAELLRLNKGRRSPRAQADALGYGGHGLLVCFPWGAPKQTLTPLWLSGRRANGYWRALFPRRD